MPPRLTPEENDAWDRRLDAFCRKATIAIFAGAVLGLALGWALGLLLT